MAVLLVISLTVEGQVTPITSGAIPCADPMADIELALISRSGPNAGRVRITGIVKNLGNAAWTATSPSHHLQMVLARKDAGAQPEGEPVQPAVAIRQLTPGQQYRIDYQADWDTDRKDSQARFIVRFFDSGEIGARPASYRPDCHSDNNRKEITAADINRLFQPAAPDKPLKAQNYRLLGGVGVNTVETELAYKRSSANAAKLTASVAAPYTGTSDDVPISGNIGMAKIRVHVPCDVKETSGPSPPPVTITYRLLGSLSLPGGSGWVPSSSIEQSIPYRELCGSGAAYKTSP
ncbi:MAG: hypothetical protein Tsb0026_19280 [Sulfuricaulis sp.]